LTSVHLSDIIVDSFSDKNLAISSKKERVREGVLPADDDQAFEAEFCEYAESFFRAVFYLPQSDPGRLQNGPSDLRIYREFRKLDEFLFKNPLPSLDEADQFHACRSGGLGGRRDQRIERRDIPAAGENSDFLFHSTAKFRRQ
jgi:hypothetical protein